MTDNLDQTDDNDRSDSTASDLEQQVEVRRNVTLSALIGGLAALLTVAFAVRAFTDGTGLDWLLFGILALVTIVHLGSLADSRAPLLVADPRGVRVREGARWRGIAWPEIDCLEHLPRRGLRDGHLLVDGYDDRQLVVPLTLATRIAGAPLASLSDVLAELADGRADVVEVVPGLDDQPQTRRDVIPNLSDLYRDDDEVGSAAERHGIAARVAAGLAGVVPGTRSDEESDDAFDQDGGLAVDDDDDARAVTEVHPAESDVSRLRSRLAQIRGWSAPSNDTDDDTDVESTDEIVLDEDPSDVENTDEIVLPPEEFRRDPRDGLRGDWHDDEGGEPPAPGRPTVLSARVEVDRPVTARIPLEDSAASYAAPGDTMTVVLDDLAVRPSAQPIIGPDLAAARERLRLTIDQLSDRTRIRPHVIEAMEVDDFGPCGGDFYARGHLRTLARVLGVDAAPLVASYDETYAHAPVDPRRVFESELATGAGGAIRSTRGGRNWSVLIAAVMGAILIWSIARLVMDGPAPVGDTPVLNQSGGVSDTAAAKGDPVKLTLTAAGGGATLNVRDGAGEIVFDGALAFGQTTELRVVPPIRITSSDGSVTYALGKNKAKALGETGVDVAKTLVAR
ncbi:helix-turn-helix transcriptional regulator [Nocardioides sp. WS12]|uniref:helix-turn-helix domain-containing protein n=1 Tax=Nocardioides sp. WS12 TaxID=2486272 RepID=UPI001F2BF957|nr:helix-turn-helix transcriptional regulator [Nocardioides sp. WS12]